ncbi:hypothetical protein TNCV_2369571, partial [Trichonephila clavipes]
TDFGFRNHSKTEPAGALSVRSRARRGEVALQNECAEEDEETFEHLQSREGSSIR